MVNGLRGTSNFTTSTTPRLKAYAPTADNSVASQGDIKSKYVCVDGKL